MRQTPWSLLIAVMSLSTIAIMPSYASQRSTPSTDLNNSAFLQPVSLGSLTEDKRDPFQTGNDLASVNADLPLESIHLHPVDISSTSLLQDWVLTHDKPASIESGGQMHLPLRRPHPAIAWGGGEVAIELPLARPDIETLLPAATLTLADFAQREASLPIADEAVFTLQKGDTLAKLLKRAGMTASEQQPLILELGRKLNPRRLQIGMPFTIGKTSEGVVAAVQVPLADAMTFYLTKTDELGWSGLQAIRPVDTLLVHASATIDGALYDTAKAANVPLAALEEFVRVMGFTVDFQRQLRGGDSFALIFERTIDRLTGKEIDAGKLHYASMTLSGEPLHFFRHEHQDGQVGWYDETGASAVRTLMRTPVNGARISSSYGMRRHPVNGFNAMHRGVDFAVPSGTPIVAAGSGRVEAAGWNGSYGKYIRIRHSGTYQTAYAHLSRISSGIGPGTSVKQGQVIGFVGSTGRSTGPHLHYEIIVNSRKVNPMTVKLPTAKGLEGNELSLYYEQVQRLAAYLGPDQKTLFANR